MASSARPASRSSQARLQGHHRVSLGVPRAPVRIVRHRGPTHHPPELEECRDRHEHHAERLATDVRERIEGDVPKGVGRVVTAAASHPGMSRLVARRAENEDQVPDQELGDCLHWVGARSRLSGLGVSYRRAQLNPTLALRFLARRGEQHRGSSKSHPGLLTEAARRPIPGEPGSLRTKSVALEAPPPSASPSKSSLDHVASRKRLHPDQSLMHDA